MPVRLGSCVFPASRCETPNSLNIFFPSIDLTVDREEANELNAFLSGLNPPPDKLMWMRASAFRIASEFLSDDKDKNVSLLRTVNYIVHAIEANCMQPKALDGAKPIDDDALTEFYTKLFEDLTVESEENAELVKFFKDDNPPDAASTVTTRATAFKVACDFLSDDKDKNTQLLRCVNVVVHAFEMTCLTPKPFQIKEEQVGNVNISLSDAVDHLWKLDANRLDPHRDYSINVQQVVSHFCGCGVRGISVTHLYISFRHSTG